MRLKLLALCAMVLGVMAVSAASAQAAPEWKLAGSAVTGSLEVKLKGTLENNHSVLLATINGLKLELLCTAVEFVNVFLVAGGKVKGGDLKFTNCIAKNGGASTTCEPHSPGQAVGTILTTEGKGQLQLNVLGEGVTVIEPNTGTTFAVVEMGTKCAFGEEVPIKGKFSIRDCQTMIELEQLTHLISEDIHLTALTALNNKATIDGSALVETTGIAAHADKLWSGIPG